MKQGLANPQIEPELDERFGDDFGGYSDLLQWLRSRGAEAWAAELPELITAGLSTRRYGDLPDWLQALARLPELATPTLEFSAAVQIGSAAEIDAALQNQLRQVLEELIPWRKGPFDLYGIHLDAEWRSDLKWNRISSKISPLKGRDVVDIGCGNGYYMFRMLGAGAERVLGLDPSPRFVVQFELLRRLAGGTLPLNLLPLKAEQLPGECPLFDTAFSMGVLYHRRDPMAHLAEVREVLKPGGELVLETLVIPGEAGEVLVPEERYAQMRNVWAVPSLDTLLDWCGRAGFANAEIIDLNQTTTQEQRATHWMRFQSLSNFLDPGDASKTIEGYPAPLRASVRADRN